MTAAQEDSSDEEHLPEVEGLTSQQVQLAKEILNDEQFGQFVEEGKIWNLEEGACQEGDVAVRAMRMSNYMMTQEHFFYPRTLEKLPSDPPGTSVGL